MHIGRLIKEVVEECDEVWQVSEDTRKLGTALSDLGAYALLRAEACDVYDSGDHIKAAQLQLRCQEMLEIMRRKP